MMSPKSQSAHADKSQKRDGGYYAIKGFLYQFDKTLIEVLRNPEAEVAFENEQDIDYDVYVLQVKNHESQDFSTGRIRMPVVGLLESFSRDRSRKLCLYCHFKNKAPGEWRPKTGELDAIIGKTAQKRFPILARKQFVRSFRIRFSENYQAQFRWLVSAIRTSFGLHDDGTAALYHSIFRSKLLDRSVLQRPQRHVNLDDLRGFLNDAEVTVFQSAYHKYLSAVRYVNVVKSRYFRFREPNIEDFERLFIVECEAICDDTTLIRLATRLARKYYRKGKSPQPYLCLRTSNAPLLTRVKRGLLDSGTRFFDGTCFDGDCFRPAELARRRIDDATVTIKFVPESQLTTLLGCARIDEVYQLFTSAPCDLAFGGRQVRIQVQDVEQAVSLLS